MKCFKRLVMAHINFSLPTCLNPLQFAYRHNRFTEDVISLALHSSLEHLDNKDTCVRLLRVDYSSTFNTINSSRLISKLRDLGLSTILCNWILSFLTHRLQSVRIGGEHAPIYINRMEVKGVKSIKFFGVTITNDLSWTSHDRKKPQKMVCTAQTIKEANLSSMDSIYMVCCHGRLLKSSKTHRTL
eukprot:g23632.t1